MKIYKSLAEKMQDHSTKINNSISDPEISTGVAEYGYTKEKLHDGKQLLDDTNDLISKQGNEYGEQVHASDGFTKKRYGIDKSFRKHRKLSKVALRDEPQLLRINLGINGEPSDIYSKWLSQVEQFYGNAQKSEEIMTAFAELNLTGEKLQTVEAEISELKSLRLDQKKEMGEAQMATKERDAKLEELDDWVRDYTTVARIAFEDNPQILEKLGILVRS